MTAMVDTSGGDAVERYLYDPYGKVTIYDDDWSETRQESSYNNSILFCGYYHDWETGLYHVRNRVYHDRLGLWLQRDPIGYADGMSLYEYVGSCPIIATDPMGLCTEPTQEELWGDEGDGSTTDRDRAKENEDWEREQARLARERARVARAVGGGASGNWRNYAGETGTPGEGEGWWAKYPKAFVAGVGDVAVGIAAGAKEQVLRGADISRGLYGLAAWKITGDPEHAAGISPYSQLGREGRPPWAQRMEAAWKENYETGKRAWGTKGGVALGALSVTVEVLKMVPASGQFGQAIAETKMSGQFGPEQMRRLGRATGEFVVVAAINEAINVNPAVDLNIIHPAHHGKGRHIAINVWKDGVKGSGVKLLEWP